MQWKQFSVKMLGLIFCLMIGLYCSIVYSAEPIPLGSIMPAFKLKGLDSPKTKAYLGIDDEKPFSLAQVKTKFMMVEFFDVFCAPCQKNAPILNRLYNFIKEDKNLDKNIKLIGIGLGTQPKDVEVYKKAFKIEFPLFADSENAIGDMVKVNFIPQLILLDKNGKVLINHVGSIENFNALLAEIKKYKVQ